jgi:hypothetical protein
MFNLTPLRALSADLTNHVGAKLTIKLRAATIVAEAVNEIERLTHSCDQLNLAVDRVLALTKHDGPGSTLVDGSWKEAIIEALDV